jgi:site-specific recombinase XerC
MNRLQLQTEASEGHHSLKTTEIYTHVAIQGMNKIKNPLDLMSV